ncbi:MAG: glycosyltransferase family 2 protein [Azonexus sp.]|nr:glycosyltransferase family 2 protein [Betaproteobacteria bacterium]MBK8917022.1 glycosyltransferase family 2 protein [Betaproteobacteria bacterium]MBP6037293.1 glycosyltransferase family 2 protein [Azonexus sp.]MBP6907847.1 glycosyltransferase family 2 protein [Azonexus sp.]
MRFSCVIPTFNRRERLRVALASVASQSVRPEEIVVVDDGSRDDTQEYLTGLQRTSPDLPLVVLRQENRGPAAARNAGIRIASGDYVAFLDDDDLWLPEKLARQQQILAVHPDIALLGCGADTLFAPRGGLLQDIGLRSMLIRNWFLTPGVVARRDVLLACGGFPEDMCVCEDYALWLSIAEKHRCALLNEKLIVCGDGKRSFGESGLSGNLRALYAGEREVYRRWRKGRRGGGLYLGMCEFLAAIKHMRRRMVVAWERGTADPAP